MPAPKCRSCGEQVEKPGQLCPDCEYDGGPCPDYLMELTRAQDFAVWDRMEEY